jgi:general secretion pathway protein G
MTRRSDQELGFTLIEIMLVVIIIGVLISIVAPRFAGQSERAHVVAAEAAINGTFASALDMYELDHGRYPDSLNMLWNQPASGDKKWRGPYVKKKAPLDPWKNEYQYQHPGQHNTDDFDLFSLGPDGVVSDDDVTNWSEER